MDDFEKKEHPAYAVIRFNRCHVHPRALFGSSIKHSDLISLEIDHAEIDRGLHRDWVHPTSQILRAVMSYSQFAEAITSFGCGEGIPITLERLFPGGGIEQPEFEGKVEQFEQEFSDQLKKNAETAKNAKSQISDILDKKSIGKGDRETIMKLMDQVIAQFTSNTSFVYDQFNKQMDKTIAEAKGEIEAYIQNKMDNLAAKAIATGVTLNNNDFTLQIDEKG